MGSKVKTHIAIDLYIPVQQKVEYIPGVLESLKFMWVQYLALLIPSLYVFHKIVGFLFKYQFLETAILWNT